MRYVGQHKKSCLINTIGGKCSLTKKNLYLTTWKYYSTHKTPAFYLFLESWVQTSGCVGGL